MALAVLFGLFLLATVWELIRATTAALTPPIGQVACWEPYCLSHLWTGGDDPLNKGVTNNQIEEKDRCARRLDNNAGACYDGGTGGRKTNHPPALSEVLEKEQSASHPEAGTGGRRGRFRQPWTAERVGGTLWFLSVVAIQALLHALFGNTMQPQQREKLITEVLRAMGCPQAQQTYQRLKEKGEGELTEIALIPEMARRVASLTMFATRGPRRRQVEIFPAAKAESQGGKPQQQGGGPQQPKPAGPGRDPWQTKRGRRARAKKEEPAEQRPAGSGPRGTLRAKDWLCPVVEDWEQLKYGARGIALASASQAEELKQHLQGSEVAGVVAVLTPKKDGAEGTSVQVPLARDGRPLGAVIDRMLVQLGAEPAVQRGAGARTRGTGNTVERCVEWDERCVEPQRFEVAARGPRQLAEETRDYLAQRIPAGNFEVYRPTRTPCELRGQRCLQVLVRLKKEAADDLDVKSGDDGIYIRDVIRGDAERPPVVWLRAPQEKAPRGEGAQQRQRREQEALRQLHKQALRMRDSIPGTRGLARNGRGFGLRTTTEQLAAVQKAALSAADLEQRQRSFYEVQGVPVDLDGEGLAEQLRSDVGWEVSPVRSGWPRRGADKPSDELVRIGGRLCVVQTAPERPPPWQRRQGAAQQTAPGGAIRATSAGTTRAAAGGAANDPAADARRAAERHRTAAAGDLRTAPTLGDGPPPATRQRRDDGGGGGGGGSWSDMARGAAGGGGPPPPAGGRGSGVAVGDGAAAPAAPRPAPPTTQQPQPLQQMQQDVQAAVSAMMPALVQAMQQQMMAALSTALQQQIAAAIAPLQQQITDMRGPPPAPARRPPGTPTSHRSRSRSNSRSRGRSGSRRSSRRSGRPAGGGRDPRRERVRGVAGDAPESRAATLAENPAAHRTTATALAVLQCVGGSAAAAAPQPESGYPPPADPY
eukprot:gene43189-51934_t